MLRILFWLSIAAFVGGCGQRDESKHSVIAQASAATTTAAPVPAPSAMSSQIEKGLGSPETGGKYGARQGELVNPEDNQMVFLYYNLAGIPPPLEKWIETDNRVSYAKPFEKEQLRQEVRAEIEAGIASVADVGRLRLTLNTSLSDYDPSYGEYFIRDIGPGSVITFEGLGRQKISLKFSNGQEAQVWKVAPEEAKLVQDKVGRSGNVTIELLLQITGVQPGASAASITTNIVEFEMRTNPGGLALGRVKPGPQGS